MNQSLKNLPKELWPDEKCERYGVSSLSDEELIAIILRTGTKGSNSLDLSRDLIKNNENGILGLCTMAQKDLMKISGIGRVKALQLICVGELSKRISQKRMRDKVTLNSPKTIAGYYMEELRFCLQENVVIAMFDTKCGLIKDVHVSKGTICSSAVTPREIFHEAIAFGAAFIVLIHNHPSGDPTPSRMDISLTKDVHAAGKIIGIYLADHIVIGDRSYYSFKENGLFDFG